MATLIPFPETRIRRLLAADLPMAASLLFAHWQEAYTAEFKRQAVVPGLNLEQHLAVLQSLTHQWGAFIGERLIGVASLNANCIEALCIHRDYRRRGLGSRLLEVVIDDARTRPGRFLQIGCEDFNRDAARFLSTHAWRRIGGETLVLAPGLKCAVSVYSLDLQQTSRNASPGA